MLEKQEEEADAADANGSYPTSLRSRLSFSELAELSVEDRFAELRDTEADYVADLKTMVVVYGRPAQKLQFLSKEERESIFCNTEQILLCNEALLEARSREVWVRNFHSTDLHRSMHRRGTQRLSTRCIASAKSSWQSSRPSTTPTPTATTRWLVPNEEHGRLQSARHVL